MKTDATEVLKDKVAVAVATCRAAGAAGKDPSQALGSALAAVAVEHGKEWKRLEEDAIAALMADQREGPRMVYESAKKLAEEAQVHFDKAMERGQVTAWVAGLPRILTELGTDYKGHTFPWLGELEIPDPGLTIFGARSGGGKTTALYNAARCLLQQGKQVLFITREPTPGETALNVALSLQGDLSGVEPEECGMPGQETVAGWIQNRGGMAEIYPRARRAFHAHYTGGAALPPVLLSAWQKVEVWILSGALVIMDGPENEEHLAQAVAAYPEHVVLLDYLQAFRSTGRQDGYQRMQDVMAVVRELAKTRCIMAGAQFNRKGIEGGNEKAEKETRKEERYVPLAEYMREAADIEQAAHLILGLGWEGSGEQKRNFWYCLKHRYDGGMRDKRRPSHMAFPVPYLYSLKGDAWRYQGAEAKPGEGKPRTGGKKKEAGHGRQY